MSMRVQRREAQKQLDEIQHAGAVPVEQDLLDVRDGRDRAWGLLRRQWLEGETVDAEARELDPDRALPEAFESRIVDADELADRLRREADRVQKQASLLATLVGCRAAYRAGRRELAACTEAQQQIDTEWASLVGTLSHSAAAAAGDACLAGQHREAARHVLAT